jgi:formylglycine-generating enzyme required for sulfatase activity
MRTRKRKRFSHRAVLLGILILFVAPTFYFIKHPASRGDSPKSEQDGIPIERPNAPQLADLKAEQSSSVPAVPFEEPLSRQDAELEPPPMKDVPSVLEASTSENEARRNLAIQNQFSPTPENTIEWVLIPRGRFNARPDDLPSSDLTEVSLSYDFYIAKTEVTISQFKSLMLKLPYEPVLRGLPGDAPLTLVGWDDAMDYCAELSALIEGSPAGYVCRLPTEAEWEYACRVSAENAENVAELQTDVSNAGAAPRMMVSGMHEDPAEWCLDVLKLTATPLTDPVGRMDGPARSLRGTKGSESIQDCGSRHIAHGSRGIQQVGFRPVLAPEVSRLVLVAPVAPR